jgi:putative heme degradation protein
LTVGLNSNILINELHLNIFPNPSNGVFTITFQNMPNKNSEIEIFNSLGQRINKDVLNTQTKTIDISSFPKGIYFLKISFGEKYVFKKIITE